MASIRKHWGFAIYCLASLVGLFQILFIQDHSGHFRVFSIASRLLWSRLDPHGSDFGTGVGEWFYSPGCGLFVFGPFTLLPEKIGLALYLLVSWAVFTWGVRRINFTLAPRLSPLTPKPFFHFFWITIANSVFAGIIAAKLEILIMGLVFWGMALFLEGSPILFSFILALTASLKYQTLPALGLFSLIRIQRKDFLWPLSCIAFLALCLASPLLVIPLGATVKIYAHLFQTLSEFSRAAYLDFENVFGFLRNSFGIATPLSLVNGISIAAAIAAATVVLKLETGAELAAVGLGAAFIVSFSPLGQNNAMILYAPLLYWAMTLGEESRGMRAATIACSLLIGFGYSDLLPPFLSHFLRNHVVKPPICLLLAAAASYRALSLDRFSNTNNR